MPRRTVEGRTRRGSCRRTLRPRCSPAGRIRLGLPAFVPLRYQHSSAIVETSRRRVSVRLSRARGFVNSRRAPTTSCAGPRVGPIGRPSEWIAWYVAYKRSSRVSSTIETAIRSSIRVRVGGVRVILLLVALARSQTADCGSIRRYKRAAFWAKWGTTPVRDP